MRYALTLATFMSLASIGNAAGTPQDEFAGVVKTFLGKTFVADWQDVEQVPQIKWAPLPPRSLDN